MASKTLAVSFLGVSYLLQHELRYKTGTLLGKNSSHTFQVMVYSAREVRAYTE